MKVWLNQATIMARSDPWILFPGSRTIRTPDIVSGADCTIEAAQFIETGVPVLGVPGKQHLFCSTTLSDGGTPILRKIENRENRIWEWASKERPVCNDPSHTFADDYPFGSTNPTDYTVKVEVCKSSVGLEPNCKQYGSSYKPTGLLQKYGEGIAGDKICSKTFTKPCSTDADCTIATEGMCINRSQIYFGLMTDTYTKESERRGDKKERREHIR